jgi:hypothetical protein
MGRPYVVQSGPIRGAKGDPGPQGPPGNAIAVGFYSPRDHGGAAAANNPAVDGGPAVRAAIQAAADAGGGIVLIDDAYWCSGVVATLGNVAILGLGPRRASTLVDGDMDRGLFAFDDTFQFQYGQWGSSSQHDNPGPIWNLLVSGEDIAGAGTAGVDDLFLMQCVNGSLMDVQIIKSAGNGLQLGASQNSSIRGGYIGLHAGNAIDCTPVGRQGAGKITFSDSTYVGTSRKLLHGSGDPSQPAQAHEIVFVDTIFENYSLGNDLLHIRAGEYKFVRPTVTNSAAGDALVPPFDCLLLIENDIKTNYSTVVTLVDPILASSAADVTDLVRIKNGGASGQVANQYYVHGRRYLAHAANEVCIDGGGLNSAWVNMDGPRYALPGSAMYPVRVINGGSTASYVGTRNTPMRFEVPTEATYPAIDARLAGDTAKHVTLDPANDGIYIYDGTDGSTIRLSHYWDRVNDLAVLGRLVQIANGISLRSVQTSITTAGQAVTLSGSNTSSPKKVLNFTADSATATVTMSGGTGGSLLLVEIHNNGHSGTSITWPSNVHFARASAQPSGSGVQSVLFSNYAGTDWYEVGPGTPSTSGDVTGPGSSTSGDIATFNGTTGKIIQDSGKSHSTDGTFAGNSDALIPTQKAVKTYVDTADALKAPLASPALTGTPTAPTPTANDNSTKIATTAYVDGKVQQVTEYTSVQTNTAVAVPAGAVGYDFEAQGSAGGGGSGRCGAAASVRCGGGGGSGGARSARRGPISDLGGATTVYVTVPAGGTGGAAVTGPNDGNAGTAGGVAAVRTGTATNNPATVVCVAVGGTGGAGGTNAAGAGGAAQSGTWASSAGGAASTTGNAGGSPGNSAGAGPGGGAGGGITSADLPTAGGNGAYAGGGYNAVNTGAAINTNGTDGADNLVLSPGQGGAGGGASITGNGGNGGKGARGAGGGGGGAALTGNSSGKGGDGGNGYVKVTWYF